MRLKISLLIFLSVSLSSCSKNEEMDGDSDFNLPVITPTGDESYLNLSSDYIFDDNVLHTFHLELSADNYSKINANPAAEQYVEGMLIFEGDTISPVGIRYKGSIGGFVGCVSGSDWTNPSGRKTCTKLSMKVKINWEGREEHFYGLKKLQFHSQNLDPSQMHERLGYSLFRQMGVPAPRSVHARLIINGEYSGVYALTEQIDGRFARYNFEDGKGNVYKEVWPLTMNGNVNNNAAFINALRTNEDENPSVEIIQSFAHEVKNAPESELQAVISASMNINEIISHAVVDRTIRNDDGPFHWYCGGGGCSNHNYYWYEEPTNQELHLIPWDLDNAFENIIQDGNPITPIKDEWGTMSNNCNPFNYGAFNSRQWSASCDKLTGGWASFTEEYEQIKAQFIEGPFSQDNVNPLIDKWSLQIKEAVEDAHRAHSDALSIEQWEWAVGELKEQLEFARTK